MTNTRTRIVAIARDWIGTPYHHQASLKGAGCDCLGLIRGIYRELYGHEAEALPAYTRDWAEGSGRETLIEAARRHLIEIPRFQAQPGDALVFRWRRNTLAKHCAILSKPAAMIHALEGTPVTEVAVSPWWRRHLAAAFMFPERRAQVGAAPPNAMLPGTAAECGFVASVGEPFARCNGRRGFGRTAGNATNA